MSWFDQQLRYRKQSDDDAFSDALDSIADAVMGKRLRAALSSDEVLDSAVGEILKYYRCKSENADAPAGNTPDEQIEYALRPHGIMSRNVELDRGWYRHAVGAMLGTLKEDGRAVALIPNKFSGYSYLDIKSGKRMRLNRKTEKLIDDEALCFYAPMPRKSLNIGDLLKFMLGQLSVSDIVLYFALMAGGALLGLLAPMFTKWLTGEVLESGSVQVLLAISGFMLCFLISRAMFTAFQGLINSRIGVKQDVAVQAAIMSRIMNLPPSFFRQYSSGELSQKSEYVRMLCITLFNTVCMTGFTSLFSLVYVGQIFSFAPSLAVPALLIILATLIITVITTFAQTKIMKKTMELTSKLSGVTYAMITGIQKIKLTGAEKRMFSRWAKQYSEEAALEYNPPMLLKISNTINLLVTVVGTLVLYAVAIRSKVSVSDYFAFNAAYGMVSAAFMSLASIAVSVANIKPSLDIARPILEAEPEMSDGKEQVTNLTGAIELSHVSFRYDDMMSNVIDDLSLTVAPGEYLAIVGSTGCGKSTLMRLLLGFETPQKGSIFYDRKDITKLDMRSLRQKIGAVMQDGKLFMGDIFSNIIISAPQSTLAEAWEAAEIASIADDIRAMPMGMNTFISEGQGGISGGQKQRLMIARAVASKPKILMFDEATSALDNVTQKKVSQAIDSLDCTRIVIAHRLSTIRHADRIVYLEGGRIAEDGTYDELLAKNGKFAELVKRQLLDEE